MRTQTLLLKTFFALTITTFLAGSAIANDIKSLRLFDDSAIANRMTVNWTSLHKISQGQSQNLRVKTVGGTDVDVLITKVSKLSKDATSYSGQVAGEPTTNVTIVEYKGQLAVSINSANPKLDTEFKYVGNGFYEALAPPPAINEDFELHESHHNTELNSALEMESGFASISPLPSTPPQIDILVAYTPSAEVVLGGALAIQAQIFKAMDQTNKAFEASGIQARVKLVGLLRLKQNETNDFFKDLDAAIATNDGLWDEIHAARDQRKADQVTVIGAYLKPTTNTAGLAYNAWTSDKAVTIVKASYLSQLTLTHELGHNLGLEHAHGYVNSQGHFQTMMAELSNGEKRVCRFSNPQIMVDGFLAGDDFHNSAAIINKNAARISAYR